MRLGSSIDSMNPNRRLSERKISPVTPEDFWKRMQKPSGCWLYDGAREINGYGYLKNPLPDGPKYITAHRLAWILSNGPIPEGMLVLHKCDIRPCCNPDHLYLGTNADNIADKVMRKRHYVGEEMHTAKLTEEQALEVERDFKRYSSRKTNANELAAKYGVRPGAIHAIMTGRSWKHLP